MVVEFESGQVNCEAHEVPPNGYYPSYLATPCGISQERCSFVAVELNSSQSCEITNFADPVEVAITKEWVLKNTRADSANTLYSITLTCDTEIVGGDCNLG